MISWFFISGVKLQLLLLTFVRAGSREDLLHDPRDESLESLKGGGSNYPESSTSQEKPTYSYGANMQDYPKFSNQKLAEGTL